MLLCNNSHLEQLFFLNRPLPHLRICPSLFEASQSSDASGRVGSRSFTKNSPSIPYLFSNGTFKVTPLFRSLLGKPDRFHLSDVDKTLQSLIDTLFFLITMSDLGSWNSYKKTSVFKGVNRGFLIVSPNFKYGSKVRKDFWTLFVCKL